MKCYRRSATKRQKRGSPSAPGDHGVPARSRRSLSLELVIQQEDKLADSFLAGHPLGNSFAGMENGAVVASAKGISDFVQRSLRMPTCQVHGDLTRKSDRGGPALTGHVCQSDIEMLSDLFLNLINGDCSPGLFLKD